MRYAFPASLFVLAASIVQAGPPSGWMLEMTLRGERIEGTPLAWSSTDVRLLGRDGRLWQFHPDEPNDFRRSASRFRGYSTSELRATLLRELGGDFEVTGTGHYLVAHRRGERSRWPQRFEDLYRSFVHYFSVRGFPLEEPPCLLLAVVCRNQSEFLDQLRQEGLPAVPGVLGYYSLESNRIYLYDQGGPSGGDWRASASTLIHEATHQTAFNTGIHSRFTPPPLWVAEGLATMFEARGVYDSRSATQRPDRINRGRLRQFEQLVMPNHRPELLAELVADDRLFRSRPAAAYALAWALSFYLVETQPAQYNDYLARTARRPMFAEYTPAERTADFTAVFGSDWPMLEARFLRFMRSL
jgi:hypothetical protein